MGWGKKVKHYIVMSGVAAGTATSQLDSDGAQIIGAPSYDPKNGFTFTVPQTGAGDTNHYDVEASDSLSPPVWKTIALGVAAGTPVTQKNAGDVPSQFFRTRLDNTNNVSGSGGTNGVPDPGNPGGGTITNTSPLTITATWGKLPTDKGITGVNIYYWTGDAIFNPAKSMPTKITVGLTNMAHITLPAAGVYNFALSTCDAVNNHESDLSPIITTALPLAKAKVLSL